MGNVLRMRVDIRIYEDSEPCLYNQLANMPPRARVRYLRNAAIVYADKPAILASMSTVTSGPPAPVTAAAAKKTVSATLLKFTESVDNQMETMTP